MMTNKELGTAIRADLKKAGYNSRDISVRVSDAGYSTRVNVKIKTPAVYLRDVEKQLRKFESIDRDEVTGEVLMGGNVYVFVEYDYNVKDLIPAEYNERAAAILADIGDKDGCTISNSGDNSARLAVINMANYGDRGYRVVRNADGEQQTKRHVWDAAGLAWAMYDFEKFGRIA